MKKALNNTRRLSTNKLLALRAEHQRIELLGYYEAGDIKKLDKLATQITRIDSRHQLAWKLLAIAKMRQAEYDLALDACRKALKLDPADADCHNNLGDIYRYTGRWHSAEQCYMKAINIAPRVALFHSNLAFILRSRDCMAEAITSYKTALKLQPNHVEALTNLGILLKEVGKLESAALLLRKAISIREDIPEIFIILGNVERDLGLDHEALASYQKAISLAPESKLANYKLALLLYDHAQYTDAISYFLKSSLSKSKLYLMAAAYKLSNKKLFLTKLGDQLEEIECCAFAGHIVELARKKYGSEIYNKYCRWPINYVVRKKIISQDIFMREISMPIISLLESGAVEYRTQKLLKNGVQTAGNIFKIRDAGVGKIRNLILSSITEYRKDFEKSNEGLITGWPEKYELVGWIVSMKNGGSLKPHIHENSWLSGSVYLNIPADLIKGEGNLILSLDDCTDVEDDSTSREKKILDVKTGDIVMFPASLSHYTTPFCSKSDRIVFAFDVVEE